MVIKRQSSFELQTWNNEMQNAYECLNSDPQARNNKDGVLSEQEQVEDAALVLPWRERVVKSVKACVKNIIVDFELSPADMVLDDDD